MEVQLNPLLSLSNYHANTYILGTVLAVKPVEMNSISRCWSPKFSWNSGWLRARWKGNLELICISIVEGLWQEELVNIPISLYACTMPRTQYTRACWKRIVFNTLTSSRYSMSAVQYPSFIPLFKTLNRFPPTVSTTDLPSGKKCTFLICNIQP